MWPHYEASPSCSPDTGECVLPRRLSPVFRMISRASTTSACHRRPWQAVCTCARQRNQEQPLGSRSCVAAPGSSERAEPGGAADQRTRGHDEEEGITSAWARCRDALRSRAPTSRNGRERAPSLWRGLSEASARGYDDSRHEEGERRTSRPREQASKAARWRRMTI
jgi:hypothetical protein